MKKWIIAALLCLCEMAGAQNLIVYNVTGSAEKLDGSNWKALTRRETLKETDVVRVGKNSALSILDKGSSKVYALKQGEAQKVGDLIGDIRSNQNSASGKYFDHMVGSLFNGSSSTVSHNAGGCSYRGAAIENDMARTIAFKQANNSLVKISNGTSDYNVRFDVIDRNADTTLSKVFIGKEAYFRITNNSEVDLYVNIIDVNAEGELYDCMPVDEGMTLSHLLIPAKSTIDLKDYPIAFSEPVGTDHLLLLAYPEPFDLRVVNKVLLTPGLSAAKSCKLGIYNKSVNIGY
ncbi:MAG: copper chaperone PCu(A)C [Paludibacteraceae bacterium]|nr:copper chaperone PCu(A)C [Paludibacteraceae bacterium]